MAKQRRYSEEDSNSTFDSAEWAGRGRIRYTDDEERVAKAAADDAEREREARRQALRDRLSDLQRRAR